MSKGGPPDKGRVRIAPLPRRGARPRESRDRQQPALEPTPEQMRRGSFTRETGKVQRGTVDAAPYRRQPLFETLAKTMTTIDLDGLAALRFYRTSHEATAASLTRCALDISSGGGGEPSHIPPGLDAGYLVRRCDQAMGAVASTMRKVALEDRTFSDIAIERFGGRKQNWLITEEESGAAAVRKENRKRKFPDRLPLPRFEDKIVPRSGRHREIIRDEFLLALSKLVVAHRELTGPVKRQDRGRMGEPSLAELTRPPDLDAA